MINQLGEATVMTLPTCDWSHRCQGKKLINRIIETAQRDVSIFDIMLANLASAVGGGGLFSEIQF